MKNLALSDVRLQKYCMENFGHQVEARFMERKDKLDVFVYSLIRIKDFFKAKELYMRLISKEEEFSFVFASPSRSNDKFFSVLSRKNNLNLPRLGLSISKKVANLAVDRNRIKRLARSVFINQIDLENYDFVIMAKKAAAQEQNKVLRDSLEKHFKII